MWVKSGEISISKKYQISKSLSVIEIWPWVFACDLNICIGQILTNNMVYQTPLLLISWLSAKGPPRTYLTFSNAEQDRVKILCMESENQCLCVWFVCVCSVSTIQRKVNQYLFCPLRLILQLPHTNTWWGQILEKSKIKRIPSNW